jgi:hypothetical protein
LFCKSNRRIAALVTVICLALLIFCLIERQVRRSLAEQGETTVAGLYAGRPAIPTGRLILCALATIKIIPGAGHDPPVIPQPAPLHLRLLDLLGRRRQLHHRRGIATQAQGLLLTPTAGTSACWPASTGPRYT